MRHGYVRDYRGRWERVSVKPAFCSQGGFWLTVRGMTRWSTNRPRRLPPRTQRVDAGPKCGC